MTVQIRSDSCGFERILLKVDFSDGSAPTSISLDGGRRTEQNRAMSQQC